jgi:hypothetical protein
MTKRFARSAVARFARSAVARFARSAVRAGHEQAQAGHAGASPRERSEPPEVTA